MISEWTLPALHVRRQAATYGWKLAARSADRVFTYERFDDDGRHTITVTPAKWPVDGRWDTDYRPCRMVATTSDGYLEIAHVGDSHGADVLRAFFGWPPVADVVWPPKSKALVPVRSVTS